MASVSDWTRLRDLDRDVALGADERAQLLGLECAQEQQGRGFTREAMT